MADEQGDHFQPAKKESKTLYDVGLGTIILKNFFAGFSRAAGAVLVYLIVLAVLYYFSITYLLPQIEKIIPTLIPSFDNLLPRNLYESSNPADGEQPSSKNYITPEQFDAAVDALEKYNNQTPKPE